MSETAHDPLAMKRSASRSIQRNSSGAWAFRLLAQQRALADSPRRSYLKVIFI